MARAKKWQPVIVDWKDAVTIHEHSNSDDASDPATRRTIGFLIRRSRDAITIAMEDDRSADLGDDNDCQIKTTIPLGMVHSFTVLQETETVRVRGPRRKKEPPVAVP